jgi:hypothetical protein
MSKIPKIYLHKNQPYYAQLGQIRGANIYVELGNLSDDEREATYLAVLRSLQELFHPPEAEDDQRLTDAQANTNPKSKLVQSGIKN